MKLHRTLWILVLVIALFASTANAEAEQVDIIDVLLKGKTAQSFTEDMVSDEDLNTILLAGINAQSAMNSQPWHFSVIADDALLEQLGGSGGAPGVPLAEGAQPPEMPNAPAEQAQSAQSEAQAEIPSGRKRVGMSDAAVAIVVSCGDTLRWNSFDAGGACDRMSVAALALGYSTRIVAGPCDTINASEEYKELLGINDMTAMAVLLIGRSDDATDALSSASTRNDLAGVVTFVNGG